MKILHLLRLWLGVTKVFELAFRSAMHLWNALRFILGKYKEETGTVVWEAQIPFRKGGLEKTPLKKRERGLWSHGGGRWTPPHPTVHPGIVSVLRVEMNREHPAVWRRNSSCLASLNHLDDSYQLITKSKSLRGPEKAILLDQKKKYVAA